MTPPPMYLVFDPERSHSRWLRLNGPAAYPDWGSAAKATPMPYARAHAFANAYGTKNAIVVGVERAGEELALMASYHEAEARRVAATAPWRAA